MKHVMGGKKTWACFVVSLLCISILMTGCTRFSKQGPGEKPDLSQPRQSWYSAPLERLNSGFLNILSGPLDFVNQWRVEVRRTNPVRGMVPGLVKGITWLGIREVVGAFEIVTFFIPWKPHLQPVDTDWLAV